MRIGTIGTSDICKTLIESMKVCGYQVIACFSRDEQRARQFAQENKVTEYFSNLDQFMESDSFDFVYIASPNALHFPQAKLALEKGKHVIVEKPICLNTTELQTLIDLAKQKKLFVFEAMCNYYLPNVVELKNELEKIKPLKYVGLSFCKYSSRYDLLKKGEVSNVFDYQLGGGSLMDVGCYNVSLAINFFGLPSNVLYLPNRFNGVDTSGLVVLQYPDFQVSAFHSKDTHANNKQIFVGEKGEIIVEGSSSRVLEVKVKTSNNNTEFNLNNDKHYEHQLLVFKQIFNNNQHQQMLRNLYRSFDCLQTMDKLRESASIDLGK